jgi:DNA invertase Pin-like site-specific DNA recombinase
MKRPTSRQKQPKQQDEHGSSQPAIPDSPTAYSYVRFSSPEQSEGDSLRRQTQKSVQWCADHGFHLDTSLSLRDLGVSAFKGRQRSDKHDLGQFLKLVERGRIAKGSYLIIENLDRLSREDERTALRVWMDILDAGVNIVQLFPETVFRHEKSDLMDVMRAIIELSRGHSESVAKSERNGASWQNKRQAARHHGAFMGNRLPGWIELRDGKLHLIPERALALKRIYQLAAGGYGHALIAKKLRAEKFSPFGENIVRKNRQRSAYKGDWTRPYISTILRDRRAVGELQPRFQDGKPDGDPIPNYYPPAITEAEWELARSAIESRGRQPGRTVPGAVNLWSGMLRDARSGDSYFSVLRNKPRGGYYRVLSNASAHEGQAPYFAFPAAVFEAGVLSMLREINPKEILEGANGHKDLYQLEAEASRIDTRIAELDTELIDVDNGRPVTDIKTALAKLRGRRQTLAGPLAEARQKAANPLSESWGEAQTLLETLDAAADQDEARLRLRSALKRTIDEIWLLVVPRASRRIAAAQIWFAGSVKHRDYLLVHQPPRVNAAARTPAQWWCRSLNVAVQLGPLDLRQRADAQKLEALLAGVSLDALLASMQQPGLRKDDAALE